MNLAHQINFPAALATSAMMAASPMKEEVPFRTHLSKSSHAGLITKMPSYQPNRELRRAYERKYGREFPTRVPPAPRRRLTRFSAAELMEMDFPEQVFLVDGLLPTGLIMTAGAPKIGKSWWFLQLAVSVASGQPFLERNTSQGAVLYLALEDTGRRLADRLAKVAPDVDFSEIPLDFETLCARADEGGLEYIEDWLKAASNPKLVIIDVWGRFAPTSSGVSKNEYEQTTRAMQPLQALANKYGIAICLVHHTRKSSSDGSSSADPFDGILGSQALTSNMDATMMLTRTRMENDAVLRITGRDIEERQFNLNFDRDSFRWNEVGGKLAPSLSPERQKVLDAVAAGCTKTNDIVAHVGKGRTAVANMLKILCDDGHIEKTFRGSYHLPGHAATDLGDMTDLDDIAEPDYSALI
ncbi:AAA family ATPase [Deinococcus sp. AJ005]|uniref:AAA family ATPase n=1 Tax=Deinococcus sp. AJ005 TaxID=2652443 RepID=UPI00125CCCA1|nr:AAA family ATPase [Deinococcus sp. AJ005]QFP77466.1 AAA family ATPase [Deinococcus sp. AJ005]